MKNIKIKKMAALVAMATTLGTGIATISTVTTSCAPTNGVPTLVPIISNDQLKVGTSGTATLTVSETNVENWKNITVDLGDSGLTINPFTGDGLTRTSIINLGTAKVGSYDLVVSSEFAKQTVDVVVQPAASIYATVEGSLEIDADNTATIALHGINGANENIVSIKGEAIDNNCISVTYSDHVATVSLGSTPLAGNYELTISNGSETTTASPIVVKDAHIHSRVHYATWDNVKNYFVVNGTNISAIKDDTGLNEYLKTHDFDGINFRNNITSIDTKVFKNSVVMGTDGNITALKFSKLVSVGSEAFSGCSALEQIFIGEGQDIVIGDKAFYQCTSLYQVNVEPTATFNQTNGIGKEAFSGCKLTSRNLFNISDAQLGKLGHWVGSHSNAYIQNSAASDCLGGIAFGKIDLSSLSSLAKNAFQYCVNLTKIIAWPTTTSITKITEGAFQQTGLTNIAKLPTWITSIGEKAFYYCTKLTDFNASEMSALSSIDDNAFAHCKALKRLSLPTSVTSFGSYAFAWCDSLNSLNFVAINDSDKALSIGSYTFYGCTNLNSIYLASKTVSGIAGVIGCFQGVSEYGKITGESSTPTDLANYLIKTYLPQWKYEKR